MTHAVLSVAPRRNDRRGFGVAPILYMLGLIGVIGGTLFSNNMQVLKSNIAVQNSLTIRSDLQAASTTLSAEAVLGSDNLTLCPPRSVHQTSGEPCVFAPVALTQLGDLGTDPHLPANAASASASGAPVEVGVFAAGAGLKQLDPYGHYYIYCRWENPRSSPASPAFVLLSAGPDGILQTKCGDTTAQGDDSLTMLTVGEAINRAALWQSDSASNVSYGATGSKVVIDGSGDLTAAGTITGTAGNFTTLNVSGTSEFGGTSTFSGLLTAGTSGLGATSVSSLSDMGNAIISGNVGIGTTVPAYPLDIYNYTGTALRAYTNYGNPAATFSTGNGIGVLASGSGSGAIGVEGTTVGTSAVAGIYGTAASSGYGVQGTANGGSGAGVLGLSNSGGAYGVKGVGYYASSGYFGAANIAQHPTLVIQQYAGATDDLIQWQNGNGSVIDVVKYNGYVGINTASPTATLTVNGSASLGATTVSSLTDSGALAVSGATTLTGSLTGSSASFSGFVSAAGFTSSAPVTLNGGASVSGGNLNAGNANLDATNVSSLTDTGFATIDGYTSMDGGALVVGGFTVNGNTALNGPLNVAGPALLNDLVGIGTNNPQAPLDIYETSGSYAYIRDSQSGLKISACCGATAIESAGAGMTGAAPLAITDMNGAHTWLSFDASGNAKFWDKVGIGTATTGGTNGILGLSYNGNTDNMLVFTDTYSGGRYASTGRTWGLGDDTGNTCSAGQFCIYDFTAGALRFSIDPYGNTGIGTSSPAAMLDINGYMHLTKYTAAPATCSAALDGDIALSANYTLCICKSGTGWVTASTGSASCAW